ncbi:hypothetical protein [Paractinoplanes toevensis]|uniref:Uncharacterized protein n=1 Tax=Paractinoplanes toevensis TaxID=571911 RepID=A0A919WCR1_9ACTN|nr:hypothetical protein [Actinoplanes toevensis]GIM97805.1 hypothetical protein Ato02nite_095980 [Actinoplanes toevensis]
MTNIDILPGSVNHAPATASYDELLAAFVRYTPSEITALLGSLADELRAGRYPAGKPYRHVNGFTKIVVAEHPSARLTLHYWPADPGAADDVSRPHDHRFRFTSLLLGGDQHFDEFEETNNPADERWARYAYRPFIAGRIAAVARRGTVGLKCVNVERRNAMVGHYTTSSIVVHRAITSRRQACATLVLRGPRERVTSHVYYRPSDPAPRGGLQFGRHLSRLEVARQVDHAASFVSGT